MICDERQFVILYKSIYKDMYRFALCMMRNTHDAEDAVSTAVVKAYENIGSLAKEEAFKSWIFTILSNTCKRMLKKKAKEKISDMTQQELSESGEHATEYDFHLPIDIEHAFNILSDEEKTIVGLSVFGGYTSNEIGDYLKLNYNTVRSKRSRALEKMGYILEPKGEKYGQ
ncbi:MAG: RNA polymerase sigma factor [Suipraeoptans sp.]